MQSPFQLFHKPVVIHREFFAKLRVIDEKQAEILRQVAVLLPLGGRDAEIGVRAVSLPGRVGKIPFPVQLHHRPFVRLIFETRHMVAIYRHCLDATLQQ